VRLFKSIRISQKTLAAHKLRTALALLGIIIGVSATIIMVAVGRGAQVEVLSKIERMGTNLLIVNAGEMRVFAGRLRQVGNVTTLTLQDAKALREECPSVVLSAPVQNRKLQVKYGDLSTNTSVVGTTPDFHDIRNFRLQRGSFFSDEDNLASRRVAILGKTVIKNLFGDEDPLGQSIRIVNIPFEVIGILEEKGINIDGVDEDDQIFIPIDTALRRVFNLTYVNAIYIRARDELLMDKAVEEIKEALRERHRLNKASKPDDFTIQSQREILKAKKETTETFTVLVGSIAAISLFVGGLGILAIMLIAIRERANEIGLRMAVGASRKDIMTQFVLEASILGVGGGLVGILLGILGGLFVRIGTSWAVSISPSSIALAFGFSLVVGLFFGVYPARRASMLDPIEALRSE